MLDPTIVIAGLIVGVLVGLTGMGGGALMTPVLVLFFGVQPLAAVSSDLVVSLFMKPVGGLVHLRRGTVHFELVKWLCIGSVPAAFGGVLLLRALGNGESVQDVVKVALGVALLLAVIAMCARGLLDLRRHGRAWQAGTVGPRTPSSGRGDGEDPADDRDRRRRRRRRRHDLGRLRLADHRAAAGALPAAAGRRLVGTDLVQAVPLVGAAALGHAIFGDVQLGLTVGLLVGAIPGV